MRKSSLFLGEVPYIFDRRQHHTTLNFCKLRVNKLWGGFEPPNPRDQILSLTRLSTSLPEPLYVYIMAHRTYNTPGRIRTSEPEGPGFKSGAFARFATGVLTRTDENSWMHLFDNGDRTHVVFQQ
jgi:hypothetical protein